MPALTSRARSSQNANERDHAARRIVTFDGEPRGDQPGGNLRGREPQLAVHALAESPAIRLPYPDEIVHLHGGGLVFEQTRHDEVVPGPERDHAIEIAQLDAEIAERQHDPAARAKTPGHALEHAVEVRLALEVRERVAHADGQLDARWREPRHVADVARDRLDRQAARPAGQLVEESPAEVDRQHSIAEPRQGDGLEAGAAAEIDGQPARRLRGDAPSFEQRPLLGHLGLEIAEHARVVLRQQRVVVFAGG